MPPVETIQGRINHNDCRLYFFNLLKRKGHHFGFNENRKEHLYGLIVDGPIMDVLFPNQKFSDVAATMVVGYDAKQLYVHRLLAR